MMQNEDIIKALFAPLSNETAPKEFGWAAMEKHVKMQNFKSFGFRHFNIYYLVVACAIIVTGTAIAYTQISTRYRTDSLKFEVSTENISTETNVENTIQTSVEKNSNQLLETSIAEPTIDVPQKVTEIKTDIKNDIQTKEDVTVTELQTTKKSVNTSMSQERELLNGIQIDTTSAIDENLVVQKKVKSQTKIVLEETYDTIIKVDTQYVVKRGLFRKR